MTTREQRLRDGDVVYELAHTSTWRRIYTCTACSDHTDDDDHYSVCEFCGGSEFTEAVGRWHAFHRQYTFWQTFLNFFGGDWAPDIKFTCELKEPGQ